MVGRILMLPRYGSLGASSRVRFLQYVPFLTESGYQVGVSPLLGNEYLRKIYQGKSAFVEVIEAYANRLRTMATLDEYDVLWVEKELWPWLPALSERLGLRRNLRIVVDFDDAIFHRYDQHSSGLVRRILGDKIDQVMRLADAVTVGNTYLGERARQAGNAKRFWLPTVVELNRYSVRPTRAEGDEVVIGWIGSPATASYLKLVAPVLEKLSRWHRIRCVAIGARRDQLRGTPFVPVRWSEPDEVEQLQRLDIGIMPLPDEPWERGKCGYKLIQYMACGIPVVASPVGVNRDIVRDGENGFFATTEHEWSVAIKSMIGDRAMRVSMGAEGRKLVQDVYSLQAQAPRLRDFFRELVEMPSGG